MRKLSITLDLDNAAFEDWGRNLEVARILRALAERLDEEPAYANASYPLRDGNGNVVGRAVFSGRARKPAF